jgi:phosphoribosylanthranilate isomerase
VPVLDESSLAVASRLAALGDWLLLDSSHPGTGVVGATGLVHDWSLSARIVAASPVPVVLAGGLGPHNVADAIAAVHPAGVDSETRTSRDDDRRRKDPAKVEAFLAAARSATTP